MQIIQDEEIHRREVICVMKWPELQDLLIQAMVKESGCTLNAAFKIEIKQISGDGGPGSRGEWEARVSTSQVIR
jgi:hypothetical protein